MAETPETNKPDFRNGFPIRDLRDGSMISGFFSWVSEHSRGQVFVQS
jgi:hypothetical protein